MPSIIAGTGGWPFIGYMIVVSQIITLFLAVPCFILLRRYFRVGLPQCLLAGALIAAIVAGIPLLTSLPAYVSISDLTGPTVIHGHYNSNGWLYLGGMLGRYTLLGTGIGFMFWLLAIWKSGIAQAQQGAPADGPASRARG